MRVCILIALILLLPTQAGGLSSMILPSKGELSLKAECRDIEDKVLVRSLFIAMVMEHESKLNPLAFNPKEKAAGVLQIRPIMVREINRLIKREKYVLSDRWSFEKSLQMFIDYQNCVNPSWDPEIGARKWNGGIFGHKKTSTIEYWNTVRSKIQQRAKHSKEIKSLLIKIDLDILNVELSSSKESVDNPSKTCLIAQAIAVKVLMNESNECQN